jgi:hypothetical protein
MKPSKIESLVVWLLTGAILLRIGLLVLIRGCLFTKLGQSPLIHRGSIVGTQTALAGGSLLSAIGLFIITIAIVVRIRMRRNL